MNAAIRPETPADRDSVFISDAKELEELEKLFP
jgi:hypothetical protein